MEKLCELSLIKNAKIYLPTYFLFNRVMKDNMNSCDILVRFLAIDNYYYKNIDGFQIYDEIQKYRVSNKKEIPHEQFDNVNTFKNLIQSIKKDGFLDKYPLLLNKDFMVIDGAHRLAIALYLGIENLPVYFDERTYNIDFDYSMDWLEKNGFGRYKTRLLEQYKIIKDKWEEKNV